MWDIICGPEADATYVGEYVYRVMVLTAEVEQVLGRTHARTRQLYYNTALTSSHTSWRTTPSRTSRRAV
jgi:hypothetical protein